LENTLFKELFIKVGFNFTFYSKTLGETPKSREHSKNPAEQLQNHQNSHPSLVQG